MSETPFEVRHVAKAFGRHRVLEDVTLSARPGELVAITGENGAGKSTLLKIAVGLLRADKGSVSVSGRLGYCPQEPLVFDRLSIAENVAYFAAAYRIGDWRSALAQWTETLAIKNHPRTLVRELSGGTRQKLNLALALLHDPDVLLLDEPYAGFDWETYLRFWDLTEALRAKGRAIVVVAHFVFDQSPFDRVFRLQHGVATWQ